MKRMLIDDTQPEETRVVIADGNMVEDVEFESTAKKQLKGNIFTAKIIRIEPSLQAAFIDYGGNRHGFLAFAEIHPDYYNISDEVKEEVEKEVEEIIEKKRQYHTDKKAEQERKRIEREQRRAEYERKKQQEEQEALRRQLVDSSKIVYDCCCGLDCPCQLDFSKLQFVENKIEETEEENISTEITVTNEENTTTCEENMVEAPSSTTEETSKEETELATKTTSDNNDETTEEKEEKSDSRPKRRSNRFLGGRRSGSKKYKISAESTGLNTAETISEDIEEDDEEDYNEKYSSLENGKNSITNDNENDTDDDDEEDTDFEHYLEIQRKLIYARKLYHRSSIQDVIKEGQVLLVQIVKEERGNKGAACTTYLSLAGRYCVLMPNRIKSGGVSRKITSASDRKRLKDIIHELPINDNMSLIIRTAGEDKKREDIVRDYNYLIRSWNHIRHSALSNPAPTLIYEEGNLIKRALRDMYTKDIAEVIIDGDEAFKTAKEFSKILSPNMSRKIKTRKPGELPVFQQYQIEKELDKLHNPNVQLASGGYLVINPTEALVSIDVNSGRATHEMDIEETALKTNLEAADEIAKQLRMRNLAGLIVVDFIDMDEPANNHAVEKRMKEAMKPDRAKVQIAKMSIFGLLEISRQRMHSSFAESNYITCPYCNGQGIQRTPESSAALILRAIEEEGIKGTYDRLDIKLPHSAANYILNTKRRQLADLEEKYNIEVTLSADSSICNITEYRMEKNKKPKIRAEIPATMAYAQTSSNYTDEADYEITEEDYAQKSDEEHHYEEQHKEKHKTHDRRSRYGKRSRFEHRKNNNNDNIEKNKEEQQEEIQPVKEDEPDTKKEKKTWWKKLIG